MVRSLADRTFQLRPEVAAELKSQKKTDIADKVCHAKVADLGMTCKKRACAGIMAPQFKFPIPTVI